VVNMHNVGLKS